MTKYITDKHYRMSTLPELSNTKLYAGETYTISELPKLQFLTQVTLPLILANEVSGNVK